MAKRKPSPIKRTFHSVETIEFEGGRIVKEVREEPGRRSLLIAGYWRSGDAPAGQPAPALGDFIDGVLGRPWREE